MAKQPKVPGMAGARVAQPVAPVQLRNVRTNLEGVPMSVVEMDDDKGFALVVGPFAQTLMFPLTNEDAEKVREALKRGPSITIAMPGDVPGL